MNKGVYVSATTAIDKSRSTFTNKPHTLTTFNVGQFVPIRMIEINPGDTFKVNVKSLVRSLTPLNPTMSNAYVSIVAIYTPNRVVMNNWYEVLGENNQIAWDLTTNVQVPQCKIYNTSSGFLLSRPGSLGHHLGLPVVTPAMFGDVPTVASYNSKRDYLSTYKVSALPKRVYCENWNEWIRDENTQNPILFSKELNESYSDFATQQPCVGAKVLVHNEGSGTTSLQDIPFGPFSTGIYAQYSNLSYDCYLLPANKRHDYFTSAYVEPQRGVAQEFIDTFLPVLASDSVPEQYDLIKSKLPEGVTQDGLVFNTTDGSSLDTTSGIGLTGGATNSATSPTTVNSQPITPVNLFAYTGNISAATINKLRQNIAVQHWLEASARGGNRRQELLAVHFGIKANPLTLNKSRYLGGFEFPLNATTAISTAEGENYTVGSTGGYMAAGNIDSLFTSSFDEHGYVMIYAMVRTEQIYAQGIDRTWSRKDKFDFFWPEFSRLGAQSIFNKEIMLTADDSNEEVFAYNDYADEYRYETNKVSGYLDPNVDSSLNTWTYANAFESRPTYSKDFIKESVNNFDRTLAVSSRLTDQLYADFCFDITKTRIMPLTSTPGLTRI